VLDLTAGFPECDSFIALRYRNIQLLPLTVPDPAQLRECVEFVERESQRGVVYVHGALGYSRSVGVVAAYLLAAGLAQSVDDAVAKVRAITPQTLLDDTWMRRLTGYQAGLQHSGV
jgi:protein-tyrosine phosphatase